MYLKLGKNASVFSDPATKLYIANTMVVEHKGKRTKRIAIALKNGHIVETEKPKEVEAPASAAPDAGEPTLKSQLGKMTSEELLTYYKENYDVGEAEEVEWNKLKSNKAKVAFLLDDED